VTFDYPARLRRLRDLMQQQEVDTVFLSVGADLPYFTGYEATPMERLTMLVVTGGRDPVLVIPELEAPRAAEVTMELRPWSETDDPVKVAADLAGSPRAAAIGDHTWSTFLLSLQDQLPGTSFRPASPITRELRMRKDPEEVASLRAAAEAADRVVARLPQEVSFAGRTEGEVSKDVIELTLAEGHHQASFWIVASGPNSASPHHEPGGRTIQPGDAVVVDFGGRFSRYYSDTTRTFVVGEPSEEQSEVHSVVAAAQARGRETARPGVTAESVDAATRSVIEDAGYGEYFIHRTGHGIGLEGHEHPYLVAGNDLVLEPGMAFSIEPGIYLPDRFGIRIEDICVLDESGLTALNSSERALVSVG
jgi:Xaa-Pro aminopeptidase